MNPNSKLHLTERAGFVIFSIAGILFLILGFLNIKSRLSSSFKLEASNTSLTSEEQSLEDLKLKDSDKDGLSDYDETVLYNTSPYITDSDADGDSDSVEIKANSDPNCPKGKTCLEEIAPPVPVSIVPDIGSVDLNKPPSTYDPGNVATTPAMLRDALKQTGIDTATLDKISDADLLKIYEETLKEQQATQ